MYLVNLVKKKKKKKKTSKLSVERKTPVPKGGGDQSGVKERRKEGKRIHLNPIVPALKENLSKKEPKAVRDISEGIKPGPLASTLDAIH